jgi:outer membrane receptor protein involved in Fe transport
MGGDRFNPVDMDATFEKQEIVDDESNAFSERGPDRYLLHLSASYRLNRRSFSSVWSFNVLNALGDQDYYGHIFNLKHHRIDPDKSRIVIPNLSYKIEF